MESAAPKAAESALSQIEDEDRGFKIVLPKKSKYKNASNPDASFSILVNKDDEFPSLGSSFSPIQKAGFWAREKSLDIAKAIAKIPSPPPTRSPQLKNSSKIVRERVSCAISEDEDYSDEEFNIRKSENGGNAEDYWQ